MKKIFIENAITIFYALIIAIIIRSLLIQPFYIPSSSMEPNLLVGDRLFVTKYSYGYSKHSFPFSPPIFKNRILFHKDFGFQNLSIDEIIEKMENKSFDNKHFLPQSYWLGSDLKYFTIVANISNIYITFSTKEFYSSIIIELYLGHLTITLLNYCYTYTIYEIFFV